MTKYQVNTEDASSEEFDQIEDAEKLYEFWKDNKMADGVNEDSYVEIVASNDDFADHWVVKKVVAVEDHERNELLSPREEGMDWDYWAKWKRVEQV
jgi:hypothetical protein